MLAKDGNRRDHERLGMSQVVRCTDRKMGHAVVLKAMLLHGAEIGPDDLP